MKVTSTWMHASWLLHVAIVLSLAHTCKCAAAECIQVSGQATVDGAVESVFKCSGVSGWRLIPALWTPIKVDIHCPTPSFKVHVTPDLEQHGEAVKWCGFKSFNDSRFCYVELPPFQDQYLIVKAGRTPCLVNFSKDLDLVRVGLGVAGTALFLNAGHLAMSSVFRLSAGSAMFMSGAVLLILFMFMRSVPQKRAIAAAMTFSASSVLAVMRYVYGTWAPSAWDVVRSKPFIYYLLVTGLLGLGATYWMDDLGNVKLNTTIRVTLQLLGLLGVYLSTCLDGLGAGALVLLLVFGRIMVPVTRVIWRALTWLFTKLGVLGALKKQPVRPHAFASRPGTRAAAQALQEDGEDDYVEVQQGLDKMQSLSFDDWQGHEVAGPSVRLPRAARAAAERAARAAETAGGASSREQAFPGFAAAEAAAGRSRLLPGPVRRARGPAGGAGAGGGGAAAGLELPGSPPAAAGMGGSDGGRWYRSPPPPPPPDRAPKSPWIEERVVLTVGKTRGTGVGPPESGTPRAALSSPAAAGAGPRRSPRGKNLSPLVEMGKILSLESNRPIHLHKAKYNELVGKGWVPDFKRGTLLPPGSTVESDSDGSE